MNNGKKFEIDFIQALNNKTFEQIHPNLQKFISFMFKNTKNSDKIICKRMQKHQKADILIKINDNIKYISLKSGSQNSVHVENIETFTSFLASCEVKQEIINHLLLYHYGDDTLIGNGKIRYSADKLKLKYKNQIYQFNRYINYSTILTKIIERFLLIGTKDSNKYVNAIYYGDIEIGIWCTSEELLTYCVNNKSMYMSTLHFSIFTYQNWCRNITFSKKSEPHRNYIQIKWFSILSDINKIRHQKNYNDY